jgi:hypothetical protein
MSIKKMMKTNKLLTTVLLLLSFFSCNKEELLNSEADILSVEWPENVNPVFFGNPIISNDEIRIPINVSTQADQAAVEELLKHLALKLTLTQGAAVFPESGTAMDFSQKRLQHYTVTSEDGKWTKEYKASFFSMFNNTTFNFEHYEIPDGKKYHVFYEIAEGEKQYVWASGNAGFALTAGTTTAENYPTGAIATGGYLGTSGVKLTTCSTGGLGALVKKPIAAGNLFLGYFDPSIVLTKPLEATQFGVSTLQTSISHLRFMGKYQAGPEYKDAEGNVLQKTDYADIYAVLYEAETDAKGKPVMLNGTNIKTAPNIVAIALLSENQREQLRVANIKTDDYRQITIPFVQKRNIDPTKRADGKYYLTVVFSSSAKGDLFEGAIGSALYIDDIELIEE